MKRSGAKLSLGRFGLASILATIPLLGWGAFLALEEVQARRQFPVAPTPLPAHPDQTPYQTYQRAQGIEIVEALRGREPGWKVPPGEDLLSASRRKVAAYRKRYRKDDWRSNYWIALWLLKEREQRVLEKTAGETAWEPLTEADGELADLVTRAGDLARTEEERRLSEKLRKRSYGLPDPE